MITITVLKNPFNLDDKEIHTCEPVPGKTAYEYIQPHIMGLDDFVVSVSGNIIHDARQQLIDDGDWLAVCPVVGKGSWLRIFTTLVLAGITGGMLVPAGPGTWMGGFWSGVAASALGMVGGALINHWFPPPKVDRPVVDARAAYNWRTSQSLTGQGNALAVTYGTMRTAGQILAQHVSSDNENQYLNILLCGGEGPVDSISDIRINDNPLSYYKGVTYETRLGDNDQKPIDNFGDIYSDQQLAYELTTDNTWITEQTGGNAVQGLEVTLQFPGGLYYMNDDSSLGSASVTVQLQYHKVGDTVWTDLTGASSITVSAATNTAFQRTYRVDKLAAGKYEVRALCTAKSGTSTRYSTRVFWTQLSSIIYDDLARPGKVLVGIKALATNQLSGGTPSITWVQTRNNVWIWNPDANQYEQKSATNPAWAAYDMIHRCRRLKNTHTQSFEHVIQGAPASRAVYHDFANWAAFCDSRNLTFNYIFNTASDLWTALQKPAGVGRGRVIMRGTRYGCVCDSPGQPVQMFTVGNILTDQFKETFVGLKDRANAIEIAFVNKDKAYERDYITAYADDYDYSGEPNITQIVLDGATTIDQAYREGKYRLRLNQYLQRTVDHSADIDAIACQINDVVLLAHDVPQWGFSGRLLAATPTTLQLDREVTMLPGKSYAVAVQVTDPTAANPAAAQSIVTVAAQGVAQETSTDTVTINGSLASIPQKWDLYSFGETNRVVKPFRVLNISRDQDLRRKITCIEYIDEIYNEATDIPEIKYSALDTTPVEATGVSVAEETYQQKDGPIISNINVSWMVPRNQSVYAYQVSYSIDNGNTWSQWATDVKALSTTIIGVKTKATYWVKVCTINYVGVVSAGILSSPVLITGKDAPPPDVDTMIVEKAAANSCRFHFTISSTPPDLAGYRIKYNIGSSTWWANAIPLHGGLITHSPFETSAFPEGTVTVMIKAVDNAGNESRNVAYAVIGLGDTIVDNVIYEEDMAGEGFPGAKTGCYVNYEGYLIANDSDDLFYPDDDNAAWYLANSSDLFYQASWPTIVYEDTFVPEAAGTLSFNADMDGNAVIYYRRQFPSALYGADFDPFYSNDDVLMYRGEGPYVAYTGKVETTRDIHQVRVEIAAGKIQGIIRSLKAVVDVPDESEAFNDLPVPASGTRLPIIKAYRSIKNVSMTVQETAGSTAFTAKTIDKSPSFGPLIMCYDVSGTPVAGLIDATIQGIRG